MRTTTIVTGAALAAAALASVASEDWGPYKVQDRRSGITFPVSS